MPDLPQGPSAPLATVQARAKSQIRKRRPQQAHGGIAFTPEIGTLIIDRMCCGDTVAAIGRDLKIVPATIRSWAWNPLWSSPEFVAAYAQARLSQAQAWGDQIVDLSDEADLRDGRMADVERLRLRIDARKWVASKLMPRSYGDSTQIGGKVIVEIQHFGESDGKADQK